MQYFAAAYNWLLGIGIAEPKTIFRLLITPFTNTARTVLVYTLEIALCMCIYIDTKVYTFAHSKYHFGNCLEMTLISKEIFHFANSIYTLFCKHLLSSTNRDAGIMLE